jgi:acyl carrier protein
MHLKKKSNKNKNTFADEFNIPTSFLPASYGVLVYSIDSISHRVLKVIREYNNGQEFNLSYADIPFIEQGYDLDSLDYFEIIQEIESEFNIEIPDKTAQTFTTFNILVHYLEELIISKAKSILYNNS